MLVCCVNLADWTAACAQQRLVKSADCPDHSHLRASCDCCCGSLLSIAPVTSCCTGCAQVIGTVYRSRYYFAWAMGHSSLALAGMDFLKWQDSNQNQQQGAAGGSSSSNSGSGSGGGGVKGVWGRCKNAQPFKVEFCDSSRLLAGYWNTTTGNFLRR